jgi:hypothetical protein
MAGKSGDKAEWRVAATALFEATLAGALAGEQAFPQMELDELVCDWTAVPRFRPNGETLADTEDPDASGFKTHAVFKRNRTPKLKEP